MDEYYDGAYTGAEIDAAIGSVKNITTVSAATIGITGIATSYIRSGIAFLKFYDFKPSSASGDLGTLPASLKPNVTVYGVLISLDGSNSVHISVDGSGAVRFNGADTSKYHYGTIVYPVA